MNNNLAAVIPVRMNSSRMSKKVLQELKPGISLFKNKILQLQKVLVNEDIIVNSESEILLEIADKIGVVCHQREPYYSDGHEASFSDVILEVIKNIEHEHIAWTPCVVPFFESEVFQNSFQHYRKQVIEGEFDSLVSVTKFKEYLWDIDGPLNYKADRNHTVSQDLPNYYKVSNGNYMASRKTMIAHKYILGSKPYLDIVPDKCSIDIDTYHDLQVAQAFSIVNSNETYPTI